MNAAQHLTEGEIKRAQFSLAGGVFIVVRRTFMVVIMAMGRSRLVQATMRMPGGMGERAELGKQQRKNTRGCEYDALH